jgi:toluene monooxygenase system protein E
MSARRTYWHLSSLGRKPSEYDIASSELLYHTQRGFEVQTPVSEWIDRYQGGSALRSSAWERFRDPRATTYASYVALQHRQEIYVDGVLAAETRANVEALPAEWVRSLDQWLGTLRFPVHGLQMVAAYLGSIAPSGKLAIAAAFQAADEVRRVQRLTQRMVQLERSHRGFGQEARNTWQHAPAWQPLRELIERLLCAYDFGEALVVLNALVKPCFDALFMHDMAELARAEHDDTLHKLLGSLYADCSWHAQWSSALFALVADEGDNRAAMAGWLERWRPRVTAALSPLLPVLEGASHAASARSACDTGASLARRCAERVHAEPAWLADSASSASAAHPSHQQARS